MDIVRGRECMQMHHNIEVPKKVIDLFNFLSISRLE